MTPPPPPSTPSAEEKRSNHVPPPLGFGSSADQAFVAGDSSSGAGDLADEHVPFVNDQAKSSWILTVVTLFIGALLAARSWASSVSALVLIVIASMKPRRGLPLSLHHPPDQVTRPPRASVGPRISDQRARACLHRQTASGSSRNHLPGQRWLCLESTMPDSKMSGFPAPGPYKLSFPTALNRFRHRGCRRESGKQVKRVVKSVQGLQ
jgi:hypothetical protein